MIPFRGRDPPSWVLPQDWPSYTLPIQRGIFGPVWKLKPVLKALWEEERAGTQGLLCQSRGKERREACNHCRSSSGPFRGCVVLYNEYRNRCANCIFSKHRDCSYATRYLHEHDGDYSPPKRRGPGHGGRQGEQEKGTRGLGSYSNPIDLTGNSD